MKTLLLLICSHYVGDFALQSDWLATNKGSGPFWIHAMVAHCAIQALGVLLITNSAFLAVGEFLAHFMIDFAKTRGLIGFTTDQVYHLTFRIVWWFLLMHI
jgi:hypothetical protein